MDEAHVYYVFNGYAVDCGPSEDRLGNFHVDWEKENYFFAYPALLPLDGPPKIMVYYPHQDKLLEWPYSMTTVNSIIMQRGVDGSAPIFFYMEVE